MRTVIFLLVLVVLGGVFNANAAMVARYEFSGNSNDSTGTNNGTLVNGAAIVTDAQRGQVLSLDGVNDYMTTPITQNLTSWTVAIWVKGANGPTTTKNTVSVCKGTNFGFEWDHIRSGFKGAACMYATDDWKAVGFGSLTGNEWYHLAATFDGMTFTTYKNGKAVIIDHTFSGFSAVSDLPLVVGSHGSASVFFRGWVDDVVLYNNALTAQEVSLLVPEPATLLLLGIGAIAIRKRK